MRLVCASGIRRRMRFVFNVLHRRLASRHHDLNDNSSARPLPLVQMERIAYALLMRANGVIGSKAEVAGVRPGHCVPSVGGSTRRYMGERPR